MLPPNCCCKAIGFDYTSWFWITNTLTTAPVRINLATDISLIEGCSLVFGGNSNDCGDAIRFPEATWTAIRFWIRSGGKLFIAGEHSGNYDTAPDKKGMTFKCLQDMERLNRFLAAMGSAIVYEGFDYNANTPLCSPSYYYPGIPSVSNLGITFTGERFGTLSGGFILWSGALPGGPEGSGSGLGKTAAAIERLDEGLIIVTGDSNSGHCTGYAPFINFLYETEVADIL